MQYVSTRGNKQAVSAAEAIIQGIAADGGLFVPTNMPKIDQEFLLSLVDGTYQERAQKVLAKFLPDYTAEELSGCVLRAYHMDKFDSEAIAPLEIMNDNTAMLELWHGPTSAFKDMALQLLPQMMSVALKKTGEKAEIVILVATSGDTGKAALEGFKDVDQIRILVFYPKEGVSRIQQLQMATQKGKNVSVVAVDGNFDDAQTGVKNIFNNESFNAELARAGFQLSSANSINWGRLVPQIVYYFSAYADLIKANSIKMGDKVNFAVPTGNFGNILAGYYAKQMGLPINKLICASNSNHVLTDFLRTGTYDRQRDFYKTNTPSMDILISSNLERLLYHIGNDAAQVNAWMEDLRVNGSYTVSDAYTEEIKSVFWADWSDDDKTSAQIQSVYKKYDYVMDTHTAVAWEAVEAYRKATGDETVTVVVSTASPYKFNESVLGALAVEVPEQADAFMLLDLLETVNKVKSPKELMGLKTAPIIHTRFCNKGDMQEMVKILTE